MTASNPVLVIADDLTGANASGARFARAGLRSASVTEKALTGPIEGFDALIVTTDSRHIDAEVAADRVRKAVEALPDAQLVVKRTDTTLRGNVSIETWAALDAVRQMHPGERVRGLVVPAYPTSGRTTVDGVQLLEGKPLEETELRYDVHNPMTTSIVADILAAQHPLTSRQVSIRAVLGSSLEEALVAGDEDLVICDAFDDAHIQRIARAAANASREHGIRWVTVDPGPAGAFLAKALELGTPELSDEAPLLAVIGSVTDLSVTQADYLAQSELVRVLEVDSLRLAGEREGLAEGSDPVAELADQLVDMLGVASFPEQILMRVQPPAVGGHLSNEGREKLPSLLAEVVLAAYAREKVSGVYSSGGDITAAILDAAGIRAFEVIGEVIPLAVYGTAIGGTLDGVSVVTKGGLIGTEVTAEACMNQLRTLAERSFAKAGR